MTPNFFAIVLIKTLWLHGIPSDPEPMKWVKPPEAIVTVQVEKDMATCLSDGAEWKAKTLQKMEDMEENHDKAIAKFPLDAIGFKCAIVLEGGIDT